MHPLPPAQYHLSRHRDMLADRLSVESWWQQISEFVLPRKSYVTEEQDYVDDSRYRRLYDTTGIDACQTLANGHSSYITPGDERWFYWSAPDEIKTEEAEAWYRQCSQLAALHLAASNFYTQLDEAYLDRSGFGICNVSVWPGKRTALNVRTHPVNSYAVEDGDEGVVDVVYFEDEKGIRQLRQMLGDNIEKSEKLRDAWIAFQEKGENSKHKILHCVYPRNPEDRQPGSAEGKDLPIASVYVCCASKEILLESGFNEMPYCVSRYLKHTGRGDQYGFSPAWRAMPALKQLNWLQKLMDLVAEKQAEPPVLIPDYLEGDVDLRAGGQTTFMASRVNGQYSLPQAWANNGRYDVGIHRIEGKQDEVNRAFHVDLFRMFAQMSQDGNSPPTATQIAEMAGEKMVQFSPSFSRFVSDFQTAMNRIFWVLLRAGRFPQPPRDVIQVNPYTGALSIENPKVIYQSKIALALQQMQNSGLDRLMQRLAIAVEAGRPDVMDNFNFDEAYRLYARNDGVPEEVFTPPGVREKIRQLRQQQMEEERQLAMAEQGTKAAGNVGLKIAS